jgi:hypothetical protein
VTNEHRGVWKCPKGRREKLQHSKPPFKGKGKEGAVAFLCPALNYMMPLRLFNQTQCNCIEETKIVPGRDAETAFAVGSCCLFRFDLQDRNSRSWELGTGLFLVGRIRWNHYTCGSSIRHELIGAFLRVVCQPVDS